MLPTMDYYLSLPGPNLIPTASVTSLLALLAIWLFTRKEATLDAPLLTNDSGDMLDIMKKGYDEVCHFIQSLNPSKSQQIS